MTDWRNRSVLILGAARQGLALARFLARNGARVTLNDKKSPADMEPARQSMSHLPVEWALGEHNPELLEGKDLLCLSGGVPIDLPIVLEARLRGIPLSNDSQIFLENVATPVIGITGSAGKTTTTTLVGRMAEAFASREQHVWVGGNIGLPLIDHLDEIQPGDLVVIELSSFQLDLMSRSPQIACITNITPNHLDRHGTMQAYTSAKAHILDFQQPHDAAVLNREDPGAWELAQTVRGALLTFGLEQPSLSHPSTYYQDGSLYLYDGKRQQVIMPREHILLRGEHNLVNVLAASMVAFAAGMDIASMNAGVAGFTGVAHRLELVRELRGVRWYNDSIATAPERTIAAIRSFDEPLVLLLGGKDKNLPWEDLASLVHQRVDHVVLFGDAAGLIARALGAVLPGSRPYTIDCCERLDQAVIRAAEVSEAGDVVLLSPGGTSYDHFVDFAERGERYRQWVKELS